MVFSTSLRVAMLVSPGVVEANAPCAAPYSTAFWASLRFHETELHAGGEAVATTNAVENFEAGILLALVKFTVVPENGAPIVLRGGDNVA